MIFNIKRKCKHDWHVRANTITESGAEFLCHKCLEEDYVDWQTPIQIERARLYLLIKNSSNVL
jgi:hypothetical protein